MTLAQHLESFAGRPVIAYEASLGIAVDAGDAKEPDTYDYGGTTETHRYNAVSE